MQEFSYTITDEEGIHARPAGEFVKVAKEFMSEITVACNGKRADGKKIFGLMSLAVKTGQTIALTIEGIDEENARKALASFLEENL